MIGVLIFALMTLNIILIKACAVYWLINISGFCWIVSFDYVPDSIVESEGNYVQAT